MVKFCKRIWTTNFIFLAFLHGEYDWFKVEGKSKIFCNNPPYIWMWSYSVYSKLHRKIDLKPYRRPSVVPIEQMGQLWKRNKDWRYRIGAIITAVQKAQVRSSGNRQVERKEWQADGLLGDGRLRDLTGKKYSHYSINLVKQSTVAGNMERTDDTVIFHRFVWEIAAQNLCNFCCLVQPSPLNLS